MLYKQVQSLYLPKRKKSQEDPASSFACQLVPQPAQQATFKSCLIPLQNTYGMKAKRTE
jgi:hypothetical protein